VSLFPVEWQASRAARVLEERCKNGNDFYNNCLQDPGCRTIRAAGFIEVQIKQQLRRSLFFVVNIFTVYIIV